MSAVFVSMSRNIKTKEEIISEEIAKRDYADLSKRDLALSVALFAWNCGRDERDGEKSLGWILFGLVGFLIGVAFASCQRNY